MTSDFEKLETIIDNEKHYLESIMDGIAQGISEGLSKGAVKGFRKGIWDGAKDCATSGLINIGADDTGDILMDIPEEIIKKSVKEGAGQIFDISTEGYVDRICKNLSEGIKSENIKLSKDQINSVLDLMKRSERGIMKNIMKKLPNNPFLREITSGIQAALEESLESIFKEYQTSISKATEGKSGG